MFRRYVSEFVCEYAGKFSLVFHHCESASRNVDITAGSSEGVNAIGVQHDEMPGKLVARTVLCERGSDECDVLVDIGVLSDSILLAYCSADLFTEADLVFFGETPLLSLLVNFLFLLVDFVDAFQDSPELCVSQCAEIQQCQKNKDSSLDGLHISQPLAFCL